LIDYMEADFGVALSEKQFEKFAELYTVLNNNSSLWVNSGWSPEALSRETGGGAPKAISVGPNMRKMFASGELDEEDFKKYLAEMGIELI